MSDVIKYLKSVKLHYTGDFPAQGPQEQQATLLRMVNGGFGSEKPRGTYHTTLSYGDSELPMEMSAKKTSDGFRVDIRVTAENSDQAPDIDNHMRKKITEMGGAFKNKTSSVSIL